MLIGFIMRIFSFIVFLILFSLGITFAFLNHNHVVFNYYFATKEISLSLLLIFSLGIGILLGLLFTAFYWLKVKTENIRLKSRYKEAEKEISNLRSLPIKGP